MKKIVTQSMIVSFALVLMVLFAGVGFAKENSFSLTDEEKIELANKLWGTDITYGEYIEQVFPDAYEKSPDTPTKTFYDMKVIWMDPSAEVSESKQIFTATGEDTKSVPYLGVADSELSYASSKITYKTWQRMVLPTPYTRIPSMTILTHLWRDNGNTEIIGIKYAQGSNVYSLEAKNTYSNPAPAYYRVIDQYSGVFPSGVTPPGYNGVSSTDWVYIS